MTLSSDFDPLLQVGSVTTVGLPSVRTSETYFKSRGKDVKSSPKSSKARGVQRK